MTLTVIALWLGHESIETTQIYLHADMQLKERALGHTPIPLEPRRRGSGRPTTSSHSSRASDYADSASVQDQGSHDDRRWREAPTRHNSERGITRLMPRAA